MRHQPMKFVGSKNIEAPTSKSIWSNLIDAPTSDRGTHLLHQDIVDDYSHSFKLDPQDQNKYVYFNSTYYLIFKIDISSFSFSYS